MSERCLSRCLLIAALSIAATARAGEPLSLLTPVGYEDAAVVRQKTREACEPGDKLATAFEAEFQRREKRPGTTSSTAGAVLRVTIVGSYGYGGGVWSGAKSLTVRAESMNDGAVQRMALFTAKGRGGFRGAFGGLCGILDVLSEDLAKRVLAWSGTTTDATFDNRAAVAAAPAAASQAVPAAAASASDPP